MSRKFGIVLVVLLLLVPMSMYATGTQEADGGEEETVEATGEPQYGGTFTYGAGVNDPPSPDIQDAQHAALEWAEVMQERPFHGAFEEFGPRGNGEYDFKLVAYIPNKYLTGHLVSDWDVTREGMTWTIRDGVTWGAVDGVMDSRPFTAEDMAADVQRFMDSPWGNRFDGYLSTVYAEGNRVIFDFESYSPETFYFLAYEDRATVRPPETIEAGADQWENQGGTGAFMFEEYVVGSYMSYVARDDYWDTTVIDGQTYELPFVDRQVRVIFPDQSTQQAALRTASIDMYRNPPATQFDTIERTSPELEVSKYGDMAQVITFDTTEPPFDDREVRRAMFVGTNIERFQQFGQATMFPKHSFPAWPGNPGVYTPLEELPESTAELYDYDVEQAKQMLADAGYPDGFEMEFYYASDDPINQDLASLLQAEWARIGVTVNLVGTDYVTYRNYRDTMTYEDAILVGTQIGNPTGSISNLFGTGGFVNYAEYSNPELDAMIEEINNTLDPEKQNELIKEAAIMALDDASQIGLYLVPQAYYWWPWVKNYYGEITIDDGTLGGLVPYMWIDENLKESMGF